MRNIHLRAHTCESFLASHVNSSGAHLCAECLGLLLISRERVVNTLQKGLREGRSVVVYNASSARLRTVGPPAGVALPAVSSQTSGGCLPEDCGMGRHASLSGREGTQKSCLTKSRRLPTGWRNDARYAERLRHVANGSNERERALRPLLHGRPEERRFGKLRQIFAPLLE